jgi:long-chain acyl-CoA synthetase
MIIDFLRERFEQYGDAEAVVAQGRAYSYRWLNERVASWQTFLAEKRIAPGSVVIVEGDFSPDSIGLFLALAEHRCVLVPLTRSVAARKQEFIAIAEGEVLLTLETSTVELLPRKASHAHYVTLRERAHPGLVLFSSGSSGAPKGVVLDLALLLEKFKTPRPAMRTLAFLLFDHIGGVNTMLHVLSNGGCLVTTTERSADAVLELIEKHKVAALPTSPTFINLILLSEAHTRHDLSSLELVTYGTEPMQESTLHRFHELFPNIRLLQTYGMSEVGILRSKSKSSDSLWVKVGGEGFETRVVDGVLHIKAVSTMLGYLNAPSPFTADGWMNTGDVVDVEGEYIRFRGRASEVINVGGEKVFPAEVESVIQQVPNVADVAVYGEKNPITGNIVCADVVLQRDEDVRELTLKLKKFCAERMQRYKVPVKVNVVKNDLHGQRFKKVRPKAAP